MDPSGQYKIRQLKTERELRLKEKKSLKLKSEKEELEAQK